MIMKTFKRFSAILIAVLMMVSMMVVPASAAGSYKITINVTGEGHTYEAYQIFTGSLHENALSTIQWGADVNGNALIADLKADPSFGGTGSANWFSSCSDAGELAEMLELKVTTTALTDVFAKHVNNNIDDSPTGTSVTENSKYVIKNLAAGYYMVKDDNSASLGDGDSFTKYIITVVKDVTVTPKSAAPTVTEKVSLALNGAYSEGVSASYGSTVYFKLTGTLPSNIDHYPSFAYKFTDTLPSGFTFSKIESVKIINTNEGGAQTTIDSAEYGNYFQQTVSGQNISFDFGDIKTDIQSATHVPAVSKDTIEIIFNATVDLATVNGTDVTGATIGSAGNTNQVGLTYSSDPNIGSSIVDGAEANPVATVSDNSKSKVFISQLILNKVDKETNAALPGAQFILYRSRGDGTYVYAKTTGVDTNSDGKYEYYYITGTEIGTIDNKAMATPMTSNDAGQIVIRGIGAGNTYRVWETTPPAGYHAIEEEIVIGTTASTSTGVLTAIGVDTVTPTTVASFVSSDPTDASITIKIVNNAGNELPETGGIGTTIFYTIGGVLVIGALSLLIVRKRTGAK